MAQDFHSITVPITSGGTVTPTEFSVDYINDEVDTKQDDISLSVVDGKICITY